MIHGENVILCLTKRHEGTPYSNLIAVGGSKSCEVYLNQDFIEVCSPVDGRWRKFIPSKIGFSASISGLVTTLADPEAWISEMIESSTPLTMRFFDVDAGMYKVGEVYIAKLTGTASVGSIMTYSIDLQGSGALRDAGDEDYPWYWNGTLFTNEPHFVDDLYIRGYVNERTGEWSKYEQGGGESSGGDSDSN